MLAFLVFFQEEPPVQLLSPGQSKDNQPQESYLVRVKQSYILFSHLEWNVTAIEEVLLFGCFLHGRLLGDKERVSLFFLFLLWVGSHPFWPVATQVLLDKVVH